MGTKNSTRAATKPTPSKGGKAQTKPATKPATKPTPKKGAPVVIGVHANGAEFSPERPGVLAHIVAHLLNAHKGGGISKADLLAKLVSDFPERPAPKMKSTIAMQVPSGLHIEKGYSLTIRYTGEGKRYSLSPEAKAKGDAWRADPNGGMTGTLARPAKLPPIGAPDSDDE